MSWIMNKNLIKAYNFDASGIKGEALDVICPSNIQELRAIVSSSKRIVPRGGGTGLAGGAVPLLGLDVVLDLSKLNRIENFDAEKKTIEVDAGVILDDLQNFLEPFRLEFPVNPSSHSVATIGGMIATDAVGSRAIKYGRTSNWVKWIEVVDGSGMISRKGATELSDYSGLEGITGVIVRACLKLSALRVRSGVLFSFDNISDLMEVTRKMKGNSAVSMIEFIDKTISKGLGMEEKYHLIVEFEGLDSNEVEGVRVLHGKEYQNLLSIRDKIYPFVANEGYKRIEDPKILVDRLDKLISWAEEKGVVVFGHLSVGILHPCFNSSQEKFIPELMDLVKRLGGMVSGEHGIGILKKNFVDINDKKILINIKKRTDTQNKFNLGKVL